MAKTDTAHDGSFDALASLFNRQEWMRAYQMAKALLQRSPGHPLLYYIAGASSLELRQMPQALANLKMASELAPARLDFLIQYARALSYAHLRDAALAVAEKARHLAWDNDQALDVIGVVYTQAGRHDKAAEVFRRMVELVPDRAHYRFNCAAALVILGDIAQAERELEACLALDPGYWRAHLSLTQVRKQTPERNHVDRLEGLLATADGNAEALANLHLALAKELEDLGRYRDALEHLRRGKAHAVAGRPYSFADDEILFEALVQALPAGGMPAAGCESDTPIFVVGMPRSGTTLVERILSSHPDVHPAGELLDFAIAFKRASGSVTPALIDADTVRRSSGVDWRRLGEAYLASTRGRVAGRHASRFVDKLPHNFLYAGFIARALPNARIICLRRHPLDTCLSNFRQLFGADAPFFGYSFDLEHTARYFVLFDRFVAHLKRAFPGRILEMGYEDILADQEDATRRLLDYCDLPWNDACLAFERNASPVATASAVQVRSPLYATARGRWKAYGDGLTGIRDILRSAGIDIDD